MPPRLVEMVKFKVALSEEYSERVEMQTFPEAWNAQNGNPTNYSGIGLRLDVTYIVFRPGVRL